MKLLLDTHIIIWLFDGDKKLSKQARDMITDPNNEIYFSALAIFEINWKLKTRPDKIPPIAEKILKLCLDGGFKCLPLELNHVLNNARRAHCRIRLRKYFQGVIKQSVTRNERRIFLL